MKFISHIKAIFAFFLFSLSLTSMEAPQEEKHTEFLFKAMEYYENGDFKNAARIFGRYAGKPVPVAEPFCLDLVTKGFLPPFDPIPSLEESGEGQKARMYFEAAGQFLKIKQKVERQVAKKKEKARGKNIDEAALKNSMMLANCLQKVQINLNTPLLYAIGRLYEATDKARAKTFFLDALGRNNDLRVIFGLKRVLSVESFKTATINKLPLIAVYGSLSLMPILHQDEGETFAKLSGFFSANPKENEIFLLSAAQFGHAGAQFLWGQSHCANESQILYWMMQCAEWNNLEALSVCGHMLEQGKGTPIHYERAYPYLKRAAHHPKARDIDFFNFALFHEHGKGTPVNNQIACEWYRKAYEINPENQDFIYHYGHALIVLGDYETALPLLTLTQQLSENAMHDYAFILTKLPLEKRDMSKAADIFLQLASQGHLKAATSLMTLAVNDEIPSNNETLKIYKVCLEKAIEQEKLKTATQDRNEKIATAYIELRNLYIKAESLFFQDDFRIIDLSRKAFQLNPHNQTYHFAHAQDLKEDGQYQEALNHFLSLQSMGYPVILNSIGSCYDLLAKQSTSVGEASQLVAKALKYYRQELENVNSPYRGTAAFNIHCLSCQDRIPPLSNEEAVSLLQIAIAGGDEDALNDLGAAYMYGAYGLEPDATQAEDLFRKAIEKGCWKAKLSLMNLKLEQRSPETIEEANQLCREVWEEHPEEFKEYLQKTIFAIKTTLKESEGNLEEEGHGFQIEESEKEVSPQPEPEDISSSSSEELAYPPAEEDLQLQSDLTSVAPVLQPQEALEPPSVLSKRQEAEQAERERLQRKYKRMMNKVEALRGKKQTKYRKIKTLIGQHINEFSGHVQNASGSGRRVKIGDTHSGLHQPHTADIKGGALNSMLQLMENSSNK